MDRQIDENTYELDITFVCLKNVYDYMKEYIREFNTGHLKIKRITYKENENSIFPEEVTMTLIADNNIFPPCMLIHTQEEWDAYVKENTK